MKGHFSEKTFLNIEQKLSKFRCIYHLFYWGQLSMNSNSKEIVIKILKKPG